MTHPPLAAILRQHDLAALRRLGQNFLVNPAVAERIADLAGVGKEHTVVEIGVGFGALTLPLARRAQRVIGLEIDRGIVEWHGRNQVLPANVDLRHQDALRVNYRCLAGETGDRLTVVANLPYSISSPILFALLDAYPAVERAVLMLQREVADRLTAAVGTRNYGVLTVLLAQRATVRRLLKVGPNNFHPRPKIDSTVVAIDFLPPEQDRQPPGTAPLLRPLVKAAFGQRRKTLANALFPLVGDRDRLARLLAAAGIDGRRRPEQITPDEYLALATLLAENGGTAAGRVPLP